MSFIVDTGAIQPIYFSKTALNAMESHGLLLIDDIGNDAVEIHTPDDVSKKIHFTNTPKDYDPANLIGLRFIIKFGLMVEGNSFKFLRDFVHF